MTNSDIYKGLGAKGGLRAHSFMGIVPRDSDIQCIQTTIYNALKNHPDFRLRQLIIRELNLGEENPLLNLQWVVEVDYKGKKVISLLSIAKTERISLNKMSANKSIGTDTFREALKNPYFLYCQQLYTDEPLDSFLLQLKIMDCIIPNSILLLDFSSSRIFSSEWLKWACSTNTPPSPKFMYLLQVFNQQDKDGSTKYWIRSNGLYRCGCPELEIINISQGQQEMTKLLHATANLFTQNTFKENEVIKIGSDGLDINLTWIRWEQAIQKYPEDAFGGYNFRTREKYSKYRDPSGILFAVEEGFLTSPELYIQAIKNSPQYTVYPKEAARQKSIAHERYGFFARMYHEYQYAHLEGKYSTAPFDQFSDDENRLWKFLVKLKWNQGSSNIKTQEELWFEVMSIQENTLSGVLINQPFWSRTLKLGELVNALPMDEIIDWSIINPNQREYNPDNIYLLYP